MLGIGYGSTGFAHHDVVRWLKANGLTTAAYDASLNAEPVGFGWRKIRDDKRSDDIWQSDFAADITIKTKDGKHFHSQRDIGKGGMSSRARNREFNIRLTVTLADIPAGEYMADFTARDARRT